MSVEKQIVTVFGGAGYLGSHLVRQLIAEGYFVRLFDNFLYGAESVQDLEGESCEVIEADMCSVKAASEACVGADAVILLAAIAGRRTAESIRKTSRDINLLASSVVVDAAIEQGVERFIFSSSDNVYGNASGLVYETAIPEPDNIYARLKLRMEERIINAKKRDFHPCVLRIGSCYGLSPRMRFDMIANKLILDAHHKNEIHIESPEDRRAFIHVSDAAMAILACLKAHVNLISGEVFNTANSAENYSLREVASLLVKRRPELKVQFEDQESKLGSYKLSITKLEKLLDFKPSLSLESSIEELWDRLDENFLDDPYSLQHFNT